jgi:predicted Zn-ribbon and HTH transcriptional regulator
MQQIDTDITVLKALQNIGALTDNFGLYKVKPFKDWPGSKWENAIFTYRLLNTGEMLDILRKVSNEPLDVKDLYKRLEILANAIWSIDERALVTEEDIVSYNAKNNTSLTVHEYIVNWMHNLEDVVITRLEAVYAGLQIKQIRLLQGVSLCDVCGTIFKKIPAGSAIVEHTISEIVCISCLPQIEKSYYDIIEIADDAVVNPETADIAVPETKSNHACICGEEFPDIESYTTHIQSCESHKK